MTIPRLAVGMVWCAVLALTVGLHGRPSPDTRRVVALYDELCANCHGATLEGGSASSLLDDTWTFGGDDESLQTLGAWGLTAGVACATRRRPSHEGHAGVTKNTTSFLQDVLLRERRVIVVIFVV